MAAAGVRTTKGLYFTFTLLGLVCLASSLKGNDQLDKLIQDLLQIQQEQRNLKADSDMASILGIINKYKKIMERIEAFVKKITLPDFPSMEGLLQSGKSFLEEAKAYIEREKEKSGANNEETYGKVRKMKKVVGFLEENHDEL